MMRCESCQKDYNEEEEGIFIRDNYTNEEFNFCSRLCLNKLKW